MGVTVTQDVNQLTVTQPRVQVSVMDGVTVLELTERPVTLELTEVTPVVQVADVGVQGPPGPQGPAGDATGLGFVFSQSSPVTSLQINHGMPFQPAGVICIATGDVYPLIGVAVTYPMAGYIELDFGVPFTGIVRLS